MQNYHITKEEEDEIMEIVRIEDEQKMPKKALHPRK
jgi:hypothetical protein